MKIYCHQFECTHQPPQHEEEEARDDRVSASLDSLATILQIPVKHFKHSVTGNGTDTYTVWLKNASEAKDGSVFVTFPQKATGYLKLYGSWFDKHPDTRIDLLRDWMIARSGNPKHLDWTYLDTDGVLSFFEYEAMSLRSVYRDWCTGTALIDRSDDGKKATNNPDINPDSNHRQGWPDIHANHRWIQYGNRASSNYVKFYERLSDGMAKFELTQQDEGQARITLSLYHPDTMDAFNNFLKSALVKALDFTNPETMQRVESYQQFLGSNVEPIVWAKLKPEKVQKAAKAALVSDLQRLVAQVQNFTGKHPFLDDVPADLRKWVRSIDRRYEEEGYAAKNEILDLVYNTNPATIKSRAAYARRKQPLSN